MNITRNAVYNYIRNRVLSAYPTAFLSSKYQPIPESFPAVFVREISNFSVTGTMTFSGVQGVKQSSFEVQIQSKKFVGAAEEAHGILSVVREAFCELGYFEANVNVLEDGSSDLYRIRANYRRVIGYADEMQEIVNEGT